MSNTVLSIVLAARNDNYGGDFTERLQQCIDWNTALIEKNKILAELIIINWNPVNENKPLEQALKLPEKRHYVKYRIITVSQEIHERYINPDRRKTVPMFEFIAKNAGIKHAKGKYILCINADILIHQKIIEFIAFNKLNKTHYYRANRLDFSLHDFPIEEKNIYKSAEVIFLKGFAYFFKSFPGKQLQYFIFRFINLIRIEWELWKFRNNKLCNRLGISVVYDNAAYLAHCHNSGDFMLMHREQWLRLKGYPEYTHISTHTDAIFTILASASLSEYVFSQPIFHQQHERRYTWDAIKNEKIFLEAFQKFEIIAKKIAGGESPGNFLNDDLWGLEQYKLSEIEV